MLLRLIFLLLFLLTVSVQSQITRGFINPGIKICHSFGKEWEEGEFTFGLELSYMLSPDDNWLYFGPALGVDFINGKTIVNISAQASTAGLGGMAGPSFLIRKNKEIITGYHTAAFLGIGIIPFYKYIKFEENLFFKQGGFFLKTPIMVQGKDFSFGG